MQSLNGHFFITGTGTYVSKTYAAVALLNRAQREGKQALGLKPVASGAIDGINADAIALQQASNINLDLSQINPFCFTPPIAPHIAADRAGVKLTIDNMVGKLPDI